MENEVYPTAFVVDHQRVHHYSDIVDYMVKAEVDRCKSSGYVPTTGQIKFLQKEITRCVIIRGDLTSAQNIRIPKSSLLKT